MNRAVIAKFYLGCNDRPAPNDDIAPRNDLRWIRANYGNSSNDIRSSANAYKYECIGGYCFRDCQYHQPPLYPSWSHVRTWPGARDYSLRVLFGPSSQ